MYGGIRSFAQALANGFMEEPIIIRNRLGAAKDDANPYGDDTVDYESSSTTVNGWFVSNLTKSVDSTGGMDVVVEDDVVRFPVGTVVRPGAKLTIRGKEWRALDSSDDETWPAMTKVSITRISGD